MSKAQIIDGRAISAKVREQVAAEVEVLKRDHGLQPCLAVALVGDDPGSALARRREGSEMM